MILTVLLLSFMAQSSTPIVTATPEMLELEYTYPNVDLYVPEPSFLATVEGVVLDQRGKPIANADIEAKQVTGERVRLPAGTTKTDAAGKFILHYLPAEVIWIYVYKEKDGYLPGFINFFAVPNDQSLVSVKIEAGQTAKVTIKRRAAGAYLKLNVTDENGRRLAGRIRFTRDDQPGQWYSTSINGDEKIQVPAVPFRISIQSEGYAEWHYGEANYEGKAGLTTLQPGQTLTLRVRLRR